MANNLAVHEVKHFGLHLPETKPVAIGGISREELDAELVKGIESLKMGAALSTDEVDEKLDLIWQNLL